MTGKSMAGEVSKIAALHARKHIDRYIIVTNCTVTAKARVAIISLFNEIGVRSVVILERTGVERHVRESPRLRAKVPRLYGIGDLSQILDDRRIEQSQVILQSIAADLITFVPTASYRKAVDVLNKHKMVVLLGDPASGKTTIANCLIVGSIDQTSGEPIIVKGFDEIRSHWNPRLPARIFYFDDFLGPWSLLWERVYQLNDNMDYIKGAMMSGCRFIFTSRNYIWQEAQENIKFSQLNSLHGGQVAIDLQELTALEKAQILFNHLRNGNQSAEWRRRFRPYYRQIVLDENFSPECARRLGRSEFTSGLKPQQSMIERFVRQQGECLVESIRGLDNTHKGALAAVYMSGGVLLGARKEYSSVAAAMELYGIGVAEIRSAMSAMRDVFVKTGGGPTEAGWVFKHPTIREAMATIVRQDPDLVEIAIRGNSLSSVLSDAACEGVTVKGARLIIPESLHSALIERLKKSEPFSLWVTDFLTDRSSRSFRSAYFEAGANLTHPLITENIRPTDRACKLFGTLKEDGLLEPDALRAFEQALFAQAQSLDCVEFPLTAKLVLSAEDYSNAVNLVLKTFSDQIRDVVERWADVWDHDTRPESYFESQVDKLRSLVESVGGEIEDDFHDIIWDEIGNYSYEMESEYNARDYEDDEDRVDLLAPSKANSENIENAEIDAIFFDVAL